MRLLRLVFALPPWRCATWLVTLLLAAPSMAQNAVDPVTPGADFRPASRAFQETFCLNTKFAQGQPLDDLPMLADLGVRWVRDSIPWSKLEPKAGSYAAFPQEFEHRLSFYREHGIGVVFILGLDNPVAYPNRPDAPANSVDPAAFARYGALVATRLKQSGVPFVLEVWNEPHNFVLAKLLGGKWNAAAPSPWVDHYLKMVAATVAAVRSIDPKIPVVTDDDMWVIHYWFTEKIPAGLAGFAFHPYAPLPETVAVNHDTDWTRPYQVVDENRFFGSAVRRLRERGVQKLGYDPLLLVTEWGWRAGPAKDGKPDPKDSSPEDVARYLPRAFVLAAAAGVRLTCWFSAQDSVDGPMGLTTNAREARPAYLSYRVMREALGPLVLRAHVVGQATPTTGPQAYAFSAGSFTRHVVWSPDREVTIAVPPGAKRFHALDVYGHELKPSRASRTLTVGASPLYLDGLTDGQLQAALDATP